MSALGMMQAGGAAHCRSLRTQRVNRAVSEQVRVAQRSELSDSSHLVLRHPAPRHGSFARYTRSVCRSAPTM